VRLRFYCGQLLIWARLNGAAPFTLALLGDPEEEVRGGIAEILSQLKDERYLEPLIKLARTDPSTYVRGRAATGLGGQDPVTAIPVLLEVLDNDHERDPAGPTASEWAAKALDEMMQTEFTQERLEGGDRALKWPRDLDGLKKHALAYLEDCQRSRGA
jgi:HEAT repeat protein